MSKITDGITKLQGTYWRKITVFLYPSGAGQTRHGPCDGRPRVVITVRLITMDDSYHQLLQSVVSLAINC